MLNIFAHADDALTSINAPDASINRWLYYATAVAMLIGSLWFDLSSAAMDEDRSGLK